jgi:hypothetical protein
MTTSTTHRRRRTVTPVKPGYLTTEFWVTVTADLGLVATSVVDANVLSPKYAALAAGLATAAYNISRGLTKLGKTEA